MLDFYENRIEDSLTNLREAVYHKPDEPDYLFALAQVSARSERYTEAADAYKKFLSYSNDADSDRRDRIVGFDKFPAVSARPAGCICRMAISRQPFHLNLSETARSSN